MIRKRVTMHFVGNTFKSAMQVIDRGNVYVSKFSDGTSTVFILVNNRGTSRNLKFIMYNPESGGVTRAEMNRDEFEKVLTEILSRFSRGHYEFEENGDDFIEHFDSLCTGLMALETGRYKGYRVRRYKDEELREMLPVGSRSLQTHFGRR